LSFPSKKKQSPQGQSVLEDYLLKVNSKHKKKGEIKNLVKDKLQTVVKKKNIEKDIAK